GRGGPLVRRDGGAAAGLPARLPVAQQRRPLPERLRPRAAVVVLPTGPVRRDAALALALARPRAAPDHAGRGVGPPADARAGVLCPGPGLGNRVLHRVHLQVAALPGSPLQPPRSASRRLSGHAAVPTGGPTRRPPLLHPGGVARSRRVSDPRAGGGKRLD